ncbi:MAG: hypothetical protein D6806_08885 [Deltaproteobacteria bacterium]|nr:MAG: hypothetical protein D6806_08885 [Deltaproteobacteria bacterium]
MKKVLLSSMIGLLVVVFLAAGCGSSNGGGGDTKGKCVQACQSTNSKEGCEQIANCSTYCEKLAALADASGCSAKFEAMINCAASNPDDPDCDFQQSCGAELSSMNQCFSEYCNQTPAPPECNLE